MRVIRQKRPFKPDDVFLVRVWRKRVYIEGWYAQVQIGKRAWMLGPRDPVVRPMRQTKEPA